MTGFRRKAMRPSLGPSSPLKAPRMSGGATLLSSPTRRASGIEAFAKPPRRMSTKRINPTDFFFGSPRPTPPPAEEETPEGQLAQELGSATKQDIDPTNIETMGMDGTFDDDPLEPEFPPTPTQLGREKAPDRPRGLMSSSPSMRHEKHLKRRATDVLHGSPLKSTRFQDPTTEENENPFAADYLDDGLSVAAIKKQSSRKKLAAELQRLKNDVADLTKWTAEIESGGNIEQDSRELNKFLTMLTEESSYINRPIPHKPPVPISSLISTLLPFSKNIPRPTRQASPLPTNPFALKPSSQAQSYLTVFAPLSLNAQTHHTSDPNTDFLLETHTLRFTAPSPFPRSLYNVSVVYETNLETQTITSVSVPTGNESKKRKVPEPLRRWIDNRLSNPLLNLDVSTLCWGINRYWEASLSRAGLWAKIDKKYNNRSSAQRQSGAGSKDKGKGKGKNKADDNDDDIPDFKEGFIKISDLRFLIPHLDRSTMVIDRQTRSNPNANARILISNTLTIDDWTGEPQLQPELSISMGSSGSESSKKVSREAKKLFHGLLLEAGSGSGSAQGQGQQSLMGTMRSDVILRAVNGTLGVILGDS